MFFSVIQYYITIFYVKKSIAYLILFYNLFHSKCANHNMRTQERKPMEKKLELFNNDGSKFLIAKSGGEKDSEMEPQYDLPQRSYFELDINNSNVAIEIKGSEDSILYDGLSGDILNTGTRMVFPGSRLTTGTTLGVTSWTIEDQDEKSYSLIEFMINGKPACSKPIRLNAVDVSPLVYVEGKPSSVHVNLGENGFKHDGGNV